MMGKSMSLALFLDVTGYHYAGWRYPGSEVVNHFDWKLHKDLAQKAERAKMDMIFMADKVSIDDTYGGNFDTTVTYRVTGRPEPITLMSALSAVTERIGIGGTVSSTFSQPFPIARMLATMDHFSEGRIAWNVVTSTSDGEARNFSTKESLLDHSKRYKKAEEFIEVIKALWDTWDDYA